MVAGWVINVAAAIEATREHLAALAAYMLDGHARPNTDKGGNR
jgi:hypothetical protein